jgi:ribonuclease E
MTKKILIDAVFPRETRVIKIDANNNIEDIEYETANKNQIKGNVYLAKVIRVEPSLQAAFIEYGSGKSGFLPFSEISTAYYNIPAAANNVDSSKIEIPEISAEELVEDHLAQEEEQEIDSFDDDTEVQNSESEPLYKKYKIQDVIQRGQVFLVQAQKEERGNKGASFTTYLSLAGKYCVLMPNKPKNNGISRRISSSDERKRLKNIIDKITNTNESLPHSIILRTAAIGRSSYELKKDYDYLVNLWNKISESSAKAKAPAFIHMEEGIIQKTIRDLYDKEVSEILIQGRKALDQAAEFMKNILPTDVANIREYRSKTPIFARYGVEESLMNLYQPVVNLPSGGYIVINPTEALTAIDVNSGKSTNASGIEETAFKTNLEAAREIAKQSRLRDLAGLIVIDFIDMYDSSNRKAVEKTLRDALNPDKAKTQLGSISTFGLFEMSRQRLRASFLESNSTICSHCNGKGVVRAEESNAMLILRTLEDEIYKGSYSQVNIYAHITAILYLINHKRDEIKMIEDKYAIKINLHQENGRGMNSDAFSIEKIRKLDNKNNSDEEKPTAPMVDHSDLFNLPSEVGFDDSVEQQQSNLDTKTNNRFAKKKINKHKSKFNKNDDAPKAEEAPAPIAQQEEVVKSIDNEAQIEELYSESANVIVTETEPEINVDSEEQKKKRRITKKYNPRFRKKHKDTNSNDNEIKQLVV